MSVIDTEQLLRELSADAPCGADLEYDPAFMEMARLASGKPAQEIGGQVIPGEEPDWPAVKRSCLSLFARTHDLRVSVYLTRALLGTDGLAGFAEGLALTRSLIERYWEPMHPRLDPDDDNDPTIRVNTLAGLADRDLTVSTLRLMPIAISRRIGRFSLRDHEIASGALPRQEGSTAPDAATMDAAFLDMDGGELQANAEAAKAAFDAAVALERAIDAAVGAAAGAEFSALKSTLKSIQALLGQQLARRGLGSGEMAGGDAGEAGVAAAGGGMSMGMSGTPQSREDIIRLLDQACDWYRRHEPSSPVPLLLERAKRLVSKNFIELVQDLSPGGLTEIQTIAGLDSSS
jgi:type VI secretion system protein ImpA